MFLVPMEKTESSVWYHVSILGRSEPVNTCSKKLQPAAQSCQVSVERPRVVTLEGEVIAPNGNMSSALRSSCCLWLRHPNHEVSTELCYCSSKACSFGTRKGERDRQIVCAKWRIAAALRSFFKEGVDGGGRKHTITIICSNRGHEFARCEELKRRKGGVWRCRAASRNANKGEHI